MHEVRVLRLLLSGIPAERTETSVARGKNYLAKLAIKGEQEFTKEMGEIIGKCLLCKRCVANCPAKTEIDRVVIAARAEM